MGGNFPSNYVEGTDMVDSEMAKKEQRRWSKLEKERKKELEDAARAREEAEKAIRTEREKRLREEQQLEKERDEAARLRAEVIRAQEREKRAQEELARARAENAALMKQQRSADARSSVQIRKEVEKGRQRVREKAMKASRRFDGHAPGPPPELEPVEDDYDDAFGPADEDFPTVGDSKKFADIGKADNDDEEEGEEEEEDDDEARKWGTSRTNGTGRDRFKVPSKFANLGGGKKCKKCNKIVGFADQVKAAGALWHTNCFRCSTCSKLLKAGDFSETKGLPYCKPCYQKGFGPKGFGFGNVLAFVEKKGVDRRRSSKMPEVITEPQILPRKEPSKSSAEDGEGARASGATAE